MRNLLLAAAAFLALGTIAGAAEVKFPMETPVAVITIPNGWTAKEDDGALDVSSPEDSVYLGIETVETKDAGATLADWEKWLAGEGVYAAVDIDGTDKDGSVSVFFTTLDIGKKRQVLFTYWAAKDEQQKYLPAVRDILRSVKPLP